MALHIGYPMRCILVLLLCNSLLTIGDHYPSEIDTGGLACPVTDFKGAPSLPKYKQKHGATKARLQFAVSTDKRTRHVKEDAAVLDRGPSPSQTTEMGKVANCPRTTTTSVALANAIQQDCSAGAHTPNKAPQEGDSTEATTAQALSNDQVTDSKEGIYDDAEGCTKEHTHFRCMPLFNELSDTNGVHSSSSSSDSDSDGWSDLYSDPEDMSAHSQDSETHSCPCKDNATTSLYSEECSHSQPGGPDPEDLISRAKALKLEIAKRVKRANSELGCAPINWEEVAINLPEYSKFLQSPRKYAKLLINEFEKIPSDLRYITKLVAKLISLCIHTTHQAQAFVNIVRTNKWHSTIEPNVLVRYFSARIQNKIVPREVMLAILHSIQLRMSLQRAEPKGTDLPTDERTLDTILSKIRTFENDLKEIVEEVSALKQWIKLVGRCTPEKQRSSKGRALQDARELLEAQRKEKEAEAECVSSGHARKITITFTSPCDNAANADSVPRHTPDLSAKPKKGILKRPAETFPEAGASPATSSATAGTLKRSR